MTKEKRPGDEDNTDSTFDGDDLDSLFSSNNLSDNTVTTNLISDITDLTDFTERVKKAMTDAGDEEKEADSDIDSARIQADDK